MGDRVLVDSCIWVDHLNKGDEMLAALLDQDRVAIHAFVIGEIALGSLTDREEVVADLYRLPAVAHLDDPTVVRAVADQRLHGTGIGYVDAHLVASTLITSGLTMWTRDKKLRAVAERLGIAAQLTN